ncbi:MAG: hypothetical protein A3G45_00150 [Candidatus Staskawiczbacteria bacterium RIFCSPLOWO2_12_FULL_37_15]|uniref:NYN domain-containing protein n=1 Tax=Candidatus Staskawiczbacteria bacterium RIFCSPLOWO2_12_FULL_37_15 TaxID=1802218 RepID=A0A1G2IQG8_9BACT|nr:MAG: hypothetical protein A3G45_00150 [Candidatus Staskawiczbacteria bacterium RIFCSPLOWO2_12_FULL_37_15]HLD38101.1 hypothetical protein [Candidatus Nanoarchaeia archaeon]
MKIILFIDGRNFISKINSIFNSKKEIDFSTYNFSGLFDRALSDIKIDKKIFYIGKIIMHKETAEKSEKLIQKQRGLKNNLEKQGFKVVYGRRVRGFE